MEAGMITETLNTPKYPLYYVDGLDFICQGKVREMYAVPDRDDLLFVVATDRVSTHNKVHKSLVPSKGYVLTALTVFWSEILEQHNIDTHVVAWGDEIFKYIPLGVTRDPSDLKKRSLIVKKLDMIPYEFIYRARMAGSLWKDNYSKGIPNPYGITLPEGLRLMDLFPDPVFTPTEKTATDDPVKSYRVVEEYPSAFAVTDTAFEIIREYALKFGIDPIDGKFEAGIDNKGKVCLGDEFGTPDCCRFVDANDVVVGKEPTWLDKQVLRNEAERLWGYEKKYPLVFSPETIEKTTEIYEGLCARFGLSI